MTEDKENWDEERSAYNEWHRKNFEFYIPDWLGNKEIEVAEKELEAMDFGDQTDIVSGKEAVREHLRKKKVSKSERAEEDFNKKQEKIRRTQDFLLTKSYNALAEGSPLKLRLNPLEFFIQFHDFDHSIMPMIVPDLAKSQTIPEHLLIMHQAVYREYISKKAFIDEGLIVMQGYRELDLEPRNRYKELRHNRIKGCINLYEEQGNWIESRGTQADQSAWERDKNNCHAKLRITQLDNPILMDIVFAHDYLQGTWIDNGFYVSPTQKEIKKFLLHESGINRYHRNSWKLGIADEKWKRPMQLARSYLNIPAGLRGESSDWVGLKK